MGTMSGSLTLTFGNYHLGFWGLGFSLGQSESRCKGVALLRHVCSHPSTLNPNLGPQADQGVFFVLLILFLFAVHPRASTVFLLRSGGAPSRVFLLLHPAGLHNFRRGLGRPAILV